MKTMHVRCEFMEPVLGTSNNNPDIHSEFIASKAPDAVSREEEIASIGADAVEEKTTTVFSRNESGAPIIWNYQIKGFFKEACGHLQRTKEKNESSKIRAYKKIIDGNIEPGADREAFCRKIELHMPEGSEIRINQRPVRCQTAQGERIALASSEELPTGTWIEFWVVCPDGMTDAVEEWLKYGRWHGMLQWRNAGFGRFKYELLGIEDFEM